MNTESEEQLEVKLVKQLAGLGFPFIDIKDSEGLLANLKSQLDKHNKISLSDAEFSQVRNHLNKGNVFTKAKTLRDRFALTRDDGSTFYLQFMDLDEWCQNEYQVTRQVTLVGHYKNRYDVTLLINGIPMVQIELKRRGQEMKEAFHQINRYQRHSFHSNDGLYQYVQIFVITNGVNTKYFANNRKQSFKQTFFWTNEKNKRISDLETFADIFLEKCHLSKMIAKYIVLNETDRILMVLRPYQYYAVENIIQQVLHSKDNGYIWHTTGSGKTLTSFKAAQILMRLPEVDKIMFVVDRKDLDYQTNKEFNAFSKGSVDGTDNTKMLVQQMGDDTRLIVTTLQKLNTAISSHRYQRTMETLKHKRIVFIFDECHRSQFGETHKRITEYFHNYQMFGFTGTPILEKNASKNKLGKRATGDLFGKRLHQYVITDAIRDENVLKFAVEYVGRYRKKDTFNEIDIEVEAIDTKELMESDERASKVCDYILAQHRRKTHSRSGKLPEFTGMFCVSNTDMACKYYEMLKARKLAGEHDLKIATIFSYTANEEDSEANDTLDEDIPGADGGKLNVLKRDKLESYIADYNEMFGSNFTTKDSKSYYNYYTDIAKRVKGKDIDILLVVNMFLTGFDSKSLNTLYVDKNLKHHGLIQAFSRTNRTLGEKKSQGNIVCFRNLKKHTDKAIQMFSDKDAKDVIIMPPFEETLEDYNKAVEDLKAVVPTVQSVDELESEDDELAFVQAFRNVLRLQNTLKTYADFENAQVKMNAQEFADYTSKYLDLRDKVKTSQGKEKVSILDDVDFELELIHRDTINVTYILNLLADLKDAKPEEQQKRKQAILDTVASDPDMRSKRKLIEKFIEENMPLIPSGEAVHDNFKQFWDAEKQEAFKKICEDEQLEPEKVEQIISDYMYSQKEPIQDDVVQALSHKPKIMERETVGQRILERLKNFVGIFYENEP